MAEAPVVMAAAMRYAEFGWPVLPCWWLENGRCACREACSSPGKHPLGLAVRHGLNDATLDRAVIAAWWRCWPQANIAIATGARSGVFVLDVDGHAGERSLVQLEREHGPLPDCYPMQWTGGGRGGWQGFLRGQPGETCATAPAGSGRSSIPGPWRLRRDDAQRDDKSLSLG
jgi:hypothetical protein